VPLAIAAALRCGGGGFGRLWRCRAQRAPAHGARRRRAQAHGGAVCRAQHHCHRMPARLGLLLRLRPVDHNAGSAMSQHVTKEEKKSFIDVLCHQCSERHPGHTTRAPLLRQEDCGGVAAASRQQPPSRADGLHWHWHKGRPRLHLIPPDPPLCIPPTRADGLDVVPVPVSR
jgi:hypothetical protein